MTNYGESHTLHQFCLITIFERAPLGLCTGNKMQLQCEKYKESMEAEEAECRHPDDYCQTRTSCMIQFLEKERKREEAREEAKRNDRT